LFIIEWKQKFHHQVSKALMAACMYEKSLTDANEDDEEREEMNLEKKWEVSTETNDVLLNDSNFPMLSSLLGAGEQIKGWQLQAIFHKLLAHLGNSCKVDWVHGNGRKAQVVVIPLFRDNVSFMRDAWKENWAEIILEHVTSGLKYHDKEDAAEWLITYLKKMMHLLY
jgi:hypothetical protein